MGRFRPKGAIAIDTETTGLNTWHGDRVFAVIMTDDDLNTWYTEWPVDPFTRKPSPDEQDVRYLRRVMGNPATTKDLFNLKFDYRMLDVSCGIKLAGKLNDVLYMARIANTLEPSYKLKFLSKKYADYGNEDEDELQKRTAQARRYGKKEGWWVHKQLPADYWMCAAAFSGDETVRTYGICDGERTKIMAEFYKEVLRDDPALQRTYDREMDIWPDVYAMEERGVAVYPERNSAELKHNKKKMRLALHDLRRMIRKPDFNPASPKQLAQILYSPAHEGGYELTPKHFTKTGAASTNWRALREYSAHEFVRILFQYRASHKAIDTFFGKYARMMVPDPLVEGGYCVHPSFNQAGARTGRFSCQDPNLQQVADSRGFGSVQARGPFGPRPGYVFYLFDYSQQEGRIFAHVAQLPEMIEAYLAGRDVNTEGANRIWGGNGNKYAYQSAAYTLELGTEDPMNAEVLEVRERLGWSKRHCRYGVTSQEALEIGRRWLAEFDYDMVKADKSVGTTRTRTRFKIVLFCKIFGGGAKAVMDLLYCTLAEAKATMRQFDEAFPGIVQAIAALEREGKLQKYIETLYGRKLRIDPWYAYRAMNYRVQGTAADQMKDSIYKTARYIRATGLDAHQLMTVHDELAFEIRKEHAFKWFLRGIQMCMEDNTDPDTGKPRICIPMKVECKRATVRWDVKEDVDLSHRERIVVCNSNGEPKNGRSDDGHKDQRRPVLLGSAGLRAGR